VSYLYYAKYSVVRDSTYFRHIDLNILLIVLEERGTSMI
jgi:hypothetical protein